MSPILGTEPQASYTLGKEATTEISFHIFIWKEGLTKSPRLALSPSSSCFIPPLSWDQRRVPLCPAAHTSLSQVIFFSVTNVDLTTLGKGIETNKEKGKIK